MTRNILATLALSGAIAAGAIVGCGGDDNPAVPGVTVDGGATTTPTTPDGAPTTPIDAKPPTTDAPATTTPPTDAPPPQYAATPTFDPPPGTYPSAISVTIKDTTQGAKIRFTVDGTIPNNSSAIYSAPIAISGKVDLKAYAEAPGYVNSALLEGSYNVTIGNPPVAPPAVSPAAGTYFNDFAATLNTTTAGATICYTIDNTPPTCDSATAICGGTSQPYDASKGVPVTWQKTTGSNKQVTLRALACKANSPTSQEAPSTVYTLTVADPTFLLPAGATSSSATVAFGYDPSASSLTRGTPTPNEQRARIHYTLDGTAPTCTSPLSIMSTANSADQVSGFLDPGSYIPNLTGGTGFKGLDRNTTIKLIACKDGYNASQVVTQLFSVQLPTFTWAYPPSSWLTPTVNYTSSVSVDFLTAYATFPNSNNGLPGTVIGCWSSSTTPACGADGATCATGTAIVRNHPVTAKATPYPIPQTNTTFNMVMCSPNNAQSPLVSGTYVYQHVAPGAWLLVPPSLTPTTAFPPPPATATVTMTSSAGADIRYTMDGSTPTCSSPFFPGTASTTAVTALWNAWTTETYTISSSAGFTFKAIACGATTTPSTVSTVAFSGPNGAPAPIVTYSSGNPVPGGNILGAPTTPLNNDVTVAVTTTAAIYASTANNAVCFTYNTLTSTPPLDPICNPAFLSGTAVNSGALGSATAACSSTMASTAYTGMNAGMWTGPGTNTLAFSKDLTNLKVVTCAQGYQPSGVVTYTYRFQAAQPTVNAWSFDSNGLALTTTLANGGTPDIGGDIGFQSATYSSTNGLPTYAYTLVAGAVPSCTSTLPAPFNTTASSSVTRLSAAPTTFQVALSSTVVNVIACLGTNYQSSAMTTITFSPLPSRPRVFNWNTASAYAFGLKTAIYNDYLVPWLTTSTTPAFVPGNLAPGGSGNMFMCFTTNNTDPACQPTQANCSNGYLAYPYTAGLAGGMSGTATNPWYSPTTTWNGFNANSTTIGFASGTNLRAVACALSGTTMIASAVTSQTYTLQIDALSTTFANWSGLGGATLSSANAMLSTTNPAVLPVNVTGAWNSGSFASGSVLSSTLSTTICALVAPGAAPLDVSYCATGVSNISSGIICATSTSSFNDIAIPHTSNISFISCKTGMTPRAGSLGTFTVTPYAGGVTGAAPFTGWAVTDFLTSTIQYATTSTMQRQPMLSWNPTTVFFGLSSSTAISSTDSILAYFASASSSITRGALTSYPMNSGSYPPSGLGTSASSATMPSNLAMPFTYAVVFKLDGTDTRFNTIDSGGNWVAASPAVTPTCAANTARTLVACSVPRSALGSPAISLYYAGAVWSGTYTVYYETFPGASPGPGTSYFNGFGLYDLAAPTTLAPGNLSYSGRTPGVPVSLWGITLGWNTRLL